MAYQLELGTKWTDGNDVTNGSFPFLVSDLDMWHYLILICEANSLNCIPPDRGQRTFPACGGRKNQSKFGGPTEALRGRPRCKTLKRWNFGWRFLGCIGRACSSLNRLSSSNTPLTVELNDLTCKNRYSFNENLKQKERLFISDPHLRYDAAPSFWNWTSTSNANTQTIKIVSLTYLSSTSSSS